MSRPKILAVDDEPLNLFLLSELLEESYDLVTMESGLECIARLDEIRPDLILLDVSMEVMDGYETCQRIREIPAYQDVPIMFLSALNLIENEVKGLALGAVDYITKPFSGAILLSRINTHIQLRKATNKLRFEQKRIGDIVQKMLKDSRFVGSHLEIFAQSMDLTNGDIVLSAKAPLNRQLILIGDFTGHGLAAALCGSIVSTLFYTQAAINTDGDDLLVALANELNEKLPAYMFMVGVLLDLNLETMQLKIWNLGLPEVFYLEQNKMQQHFESQGLPFGVVKLQSGAIKPYEVTMTPHSQVFVYTDGITEMLSPQGEMLNENNLLHFLETQYHQDEPLAPQIERFTKNYTQTEAFGDDLTLVSVRLDKTL